MEYEKEIYRKHNFKVLELFGINNGVCNCPSGILCGNSSGKHPKHKGGLNNPTPLEDISSNSNIGIICGIDGLVVLDIDGRNGGFESLSNLEKAFGKLPKTLTVTSGSGGKHFYFKSKLPIRKCKLKDFKGIDVQAIGSYVVAPNSMHLSGNRYSFDDIDEDILELPQEIVDLIPTTPVLLERNNNPEPTDYTKEEIIAALQFLNPDCTYDLWWKIGAALYNSGLEFEVFNWWSRGSNSKYNELVTKKKWDSFAKEPTQISCGTIIYHAELAGFKREKENLLDDITLDIPTKKESKDIVTVVEKIETEVKKLVDELDVIVDYPAGSVGVLAQWIFDNALYKNKTYAIQAAITVASGICQGLHRTSFMNGKISNTSILLADAGSGKMHYTERVGDIINTIDNGLRLGNLQSKQGLHSNLYKCNNRVIIQSESLSFFLKICNEKNHVMNQISESFLTCWDSSNWLDELVTKKECNSIGGIPEAHLTMLGGGVTSDFLNLINNPMFAESGLLSRIDVIIEDTFEKNTNKHISAEFTGEVNAIINNLAAIRKQAKIKSSIDLNFDENNAVAKRHFTKTFEINIADCYDEWQAHANYFLALKDEILDLVPASRSNVVTGLLHRAAEKILRVACCLTAVDLHNITQKKLNPEHLNWSFNWYKKQYFKLFKMLGVHLSANNANDLTEYLYKVCIEHKDKFNTKNFTYRDLYQFRRKTLSKYSRREIDDALANLSTRFAFEIDRRKNGYKITLP